MPRVKGHGLPRDTSPDDMLGAYAASEEDGLFRLHCLPEKFAVKLLQASPRVRQTAIGRELRLNRVSHASLARFSGELHVHVHLQRAPCCDLRNAR